MIKQSRILELNSKCFLQTPQLSVENIFFSCLYPRTTIRQTNVRNFEITLPLRLGCCVGTLGNKSVKSFGLNLLN
ncbi:hypothetical protein KC19_VG280500 [Ceratodon purpureus]|uniref:Uncharacterized protein n=1 Tax=Ceratodon purpureus TaxID=3225 RepID=A0A8T0HUY2_CERPU|nr:hypothetical protein KC19_VG280500 [Ceratodon purpureus]